MIEKLLQEQYPQVQISIREREKVIILERIVVPDELQGNGLGTKIMNELCAYADSKNAQIGLTPDLVFGASSKKRLEGFYRRFDFHQNKGRRRDDAILESMLREPMRPELRPLNRQSELPKDLASKRGISAEIGH